jgi:hypothetical protein
MRSGFHENIHCSSYFVHFIFIQDPALGIQIFMYGAALNNCHCNLLNLAQERSSIPALLIFDRGEDNGLGCLPSPRQSSIFFLWGESAALHF